MADIPYLPMPSSLTAPQRPGRSQPPTSGGRRKQPVDGKAVPRRPDVVDEDAVSLGEPALPSEYPEAAVLADQLTRPPTSAGGGGILQRHATADMSGWRLAVTGLFENQADDGQPYNRVMRYIIQVTCNDDDSSAGESWKVYRKYSEFYVLEEKLREFHGAALGDLPLQSKRLIGNSNPEFLQTKRLELESFLRALLAKPLLRQSQLLRLFLADQDQEFETSLLPDLSLNRLTSKFQRRGFFLAKDFLPGLLASTQAPRPEPAARSEAARATPESLKQSRLHNYLFWNNAALSADQSPSLTAPCPVTVPRITGIYDLALFLLERVLVTKGAGAGDDGGGGVGAWWRRWVCHLLVGLRPLARPLLDRLVRDLVNSKVHELTREHRAVPIVHLFRDLIFYPERRGTQADSDKQRRRSDSLDAVKSVCSSVYLSQALGREPVEVTLARLHDLLQHPRVNKQLLYTLLDPLVLQLFPELHYQPA